MSDDNLRPLVDYRVRPSPEFVRLRSHDLRLRFLEQRIGVAAPGARGDLGPMGPMPEHEWDGALLRFQQGPDGDAWGAWTNLQGPQGPERVHYVPIAGGGGGPVIVNGYYPQGW